MAGTPLHFTMRELQGLLRSPLFWIAIAGVSILLGLTGPFGTYEGLRLPARLAYWAAIATASYLVGASSVALLAGLVRLGGPPGPLAWAFYGALAGLPVTVTVWAINAVVFEKPDQIIPFWPLLGYTAAISAVVSALVSIFTERFERAGKAAAPSAPFRPRILDRLPPHLRGELSHLSVQDHYVEIRTDKGGKLVLMRLADAIAETQGVEGLQIHRSHWVAAAQVEQPVRVGGRLMLRLRDGTLVPVSRSYLASVRAAGLA